MRVAVAGFQHETNTFLAEETDYEAFEIADAWPQFLRGDEVLSETHGMNLPVAGFIEGATNAGWDLVPLLWCSAGPSGPVSAEAYNRITDEILFRLAEVGPVDAVYLDLHGAMVAVGTADADGDLLARIRGCVGPDAYIVASLDMHANVSQKMADIADALLLYRTYPHVDMAATGNRAVARLKKLADLDGEKLQVCHQPLPFLLPMGVQSTLDRPMSDVMAKIAEIENWGGLIELATGFPLADVPECGPAIIAYGNCAKASSEQLYEYLLQLEGKFKEELHTPSEALKTCTRLVKNNPEGPIILVDTQDNPGCGGTGDTVGLLAALVTADIEGTVAGVLCDADTCAVAHMAGIGAAIEVSIGAQHGFGEVPLGVLARVEALANGRFVGTGPFYQGCHFELGPMAVLSIGNVRLVLASKRQQAADQAMFRHVGIDPSAARVLALKSSVHYRADFGSMAHQIITVVSPGANIVTLEKLPYQNLHADKRIAGSKNSKRIIK